ncbi:MAG: hypothetical protein JSV62_02830 [Promethearchaeota archaeon]|nr:MAG: hypothetical protein JSV62_02830 [Candidatus Lokiarchaeota archaeon]
MIEKKIKRFIPTERVILITGILLIIISFISEFHFHYIQGFSPELVEADIFWRAEAAEVFNSMIFLVFGIILIIIAFRFSKKRLSERK